MVEQKQQQFSPSFRGASNISSFWNACQGPFSGTGVGNLCADGSIACTFTTDEVDNYKEEKDDDSILEPRQQTALKVHPSPHVQQRVRNLMDDIFSPFMHCVQPPLPACTAISVERGLCEFPDCNRLRRQNSHKEFPLPPSASSSFQNSVHRGSYSSVSGGMAENMVSGVDNSLRRGTNATKTGHGVATQTKVNVNDVLCGRGISVSRHVGNLNFLDLIDANKDGYGKLTKKEKIMLARRIVDTVLYHTDPPGRFIGRDAASGLWYDIGMERSLEKASQALREKSATARKVERATCTSFCVETVASFDVGIPDVIEVTTTEEINEVNAKELSRATTIKINNHRNGPVEPRPCAIPDHLRNVYLHKQIVPPPTPQLTPMYLNQLKPQLPTGFYRPHATSQTYGVAPPHKPCFATFGASQLSSCHPLEHHLPVSRSSSEIVEGRRMDAACNSAAAPGSMTSPYVAPVSPPFSGGAQPSTVPHCVDSPPRRNFHHPLHPPVSSSSALVTPNGQFSNSHESPSTRYLMTKNSVSLERELWGGPEQQCKAFKDNDEPIFPLDVFASYSSSGNETRQHAPTLVSPSREQKQSKRQRLSKIFLDESFESSCLELDTSRESIEAPACSKTIKDGTGQSTQRLAEAIGLQLRLDDSDIRSPTEMIQSYAGGRRRRSEPLPRPPKATTALDTSADSTDGLAALSSAAFLRLDESF